MARAVPLHLNDDAQQPLDLAAVVVVARRWERAAFRSSFRARERMGVLEWAEQRRYLSPEANALAADSGGPVRYSTDLTPYHREVMLALSDPATEIVVCKFPSQDGKTEILNNFVGQRIDIEPGPMLVLQPTGDLAQAWSKDRLAPMIRDCPSLTGKVRDARSRDADNTILQKKFPGGHITVTGSNSPAGLSARPIRDVLVDEVDRCARSAGTEGDSIRLAFRRATTFRRGKKLLISSPTIKKQSRIDAEYQLGTQEEFHVPCPDCGAYQFLVWGGPEVRYGMKWEPGDTEGDTAHYVCVTNGCVIDEQSKPEMIANGKWIAQNPDVGVRRRSFWKNALTSNLVSWRKLIAEWHEVQGKPEELQQFINTVLCELYDPVDGLDVDVDVLEKRQGLGYPEDNELGPGTVPAAVAILTRAVDVQGDRLEMAVWGWGDREEAWLIDWQLFEGDPATEQPWLALDAELAKEYAHESGAKLKARVTFVDSGGHHTSEVYSYCRRRQKRGVFAIKGSSIATHPLLGRPSRPDNAKTILYPVGSFTGKEALVKRLTKILLPGPGFIHLPLWLSEDQIAQFSGEKLSNRVQRGGKRVRAWIKTGRNEMMDLFVYARAALHKLGPNVVRGLGDLAKQLVPAPPSESTPSATESPSILTQSRPTRPRSGWVNNWRK